MNLPNLKEARKRTKEKVLIKTNEYIIKENLKDLGLGKKYYVKTYGCQMNEHDTENIKAILEDMSFEELEEKLKSMNDSGVQPEDFSLTGEQFRMELIEKLSEVKVVTSWGEEIGRYFYVDYDTELSEVYCYDYEDWKLYGFSYSVDNDAITIDFNTKKRKKISIVDFEGEDNQCIYEYLYNQYDSVITSKHQSEFEAERNDYESKYSELETKFNSAEDKISTLNNELDELREFKLNVEKNEKAEAIKNVMSKFSDLEGYELFEALKAECENYSLEELEEKCFAIRGRKNTKTTFSTNKPQTPKIPAGGATVNTEEDPYGGIVNKYKKN